MLALRLTPGCGESLAGFLSRLAERNGASIDYVQNFARSIGLPFTSIGVLETKPTDLALMARDTGVSETNLRDMAFWPDQSGFIHIGSGLVRRHDIGMAYRKICPECLAQSGVHRRYWHLRAVNACVMHRVSLVSQCTACTRQLSWLNSSVTRCACGQDLTRIRAASLGGARSLGTATANVVLGIGPPGHLQEVELSGPIAALNASDLFSLMLHLGWFSEHGKVVSRAAFFEQSRHLVSAAFDKGAAVIRQWPVNTLSLFDEMANGNIGRPGRYGVRRDLGPVIRWAARLDAGSPLKPLMLEVIKDWAAQRQQAPTRIKSLRHQDDRGLLMTISEGARLLNLRKERLRDFGTAYGLIVYTPEKPGSGAPILVSRVDIEQLQFDKQDLLGERAAARLLGCCPKTLGWLAQGGVLPPASSPASKLSKTPLWSTKALTAFVNTLSGLSAPGAEESKRPTMPLVRALRLLGTRGWSAQEAIAGLTGGLWAPLVVSSLKPGLGAFGAPAAMIAATRAERSPNHVSVTKFARMARLTGETAYAMVRLGLIRTVPAGGDAGAGRLIDHSELMRFKADYFLPAHVDREFKRRNGSTVRELMALGLRPLVGPGANGRHSYVFSRAEVLAVHEAAGKDQDHENSQNSVAKPIQKIMLAQLLTIR